MKKIYYIFASLLILAGCSDRLNVAENLIVPDGEMAVKLKVDGAMAGPGTRSYVNGNETAISAIKMLCFDGDGAFITSRDGNVESIDATHGTLTGSVPANTCRVHFVANFNGLDISSFPMGTPERAMMKSSQLSSGITDDVRFWGYHKENTPSAMASYLRGGNTLILLRDRAKVTVVNNDRDIKSLQWTISNGLNRGFVAAASSSDNNNPFDNSYATSTILTEYRSSGTYTLTDAESIWTGPTTASAENPQFLFENANSTDPVKIIVKATFQDNSVRYHTILLQDNDKKQYRIYRNQNFVLTILDLPSSSQSSIGSDNFTDAVNTTNYSNNPFAQVAREVNEVNDEQYRLKVEEVSQIYSTGTVGTVNFTFTKQDGSGTSFSNSDFEVSWEPKEDTDERPDVSPVTTAPTVNYNASTGEGSITFPLNTITSQLKFNTLQVVSPSGLTRYVDVYSIISFPFATAPTLVDNGTKRTVDNIARETYKLTFALPATLPDAVYPLTVKLYTGTLVPFSDSTPTAPHNSFNVAVGKTNTLDATDQIAQWNYNANKWDSWYEYVINEPSADNTYTVYLNEYCYELFPDRVLSTVGLYFEIDHFGGPIPLSAAAPQPTATTLTFNASDFNVGAFNRSDSHTISPITVSIGNSDSESGYFTAGYSIWYLIGTSYFNGNITVSTSDTKSILNKIEINYTSSSYTGGTVTPSTGTFAKNGATGTWTGTGTGNTTEVSMEMGRTSSNAFARVASIKVTYLSY